MIYMSFGSIGESMEDLTPRQQQVLEYISRFVNEHGYPPTLREISKQLGTSGTVSALRHLEALERKGHIRRDPGSSRGIAVNVDQNGEVVHIPIVGVVRAGLPTLALEEIEGYYPLERLQLRGGSFFLRVKGDSMINDAIVDGDLALIRPQATVENGDIVVALIDGEATLKRFYREANHIRLQPRNPNMDAIIIPAGDEITVIGKVVKIIRDIE
jgi:repressor LexA